MSSRRHSLGVLVLVILMASSSSSLAEKGEFQFFIGAGMLFPQNIETTDKTYVAYSSLLLGGQTYFGISDNFDLGVNFNYSYFQNSTVKGYTPPDEKGLVGDLWFDYRRITLVGQLRYNVFPGYMISPHVFVGGGGTFETFYNQTFFTDVTSKNYDDYAVASWLIEGGADVTWRVWWIFLVKVEATYAYSPYSKGFEAMGYIGADWFLKSTNIR